MKKPLFRLMPGKLAVFCLTLAVSFSLVNFSAFAYPQKDLINPIVAENGYQVRPVCVQGLTDIKNLQVSTAIDGSMRLTTETGVEDEFRFCFSNAKETTPLKVDVEKSRYLIMNVCRADASMTLKVVLGGIESVLFDGSQTPLPLGYSSFDLSKLDGFSAAKYTPMIVSFMVHWNSGAGANQEIDLGGLWLADSSSFRPQQYEDISTARKVTLTPDTIDAVAQEGLVTFSDDKSAVTSSTSDDGAKTGTVKMVINDFDLDKYTSLYVYVPYNDAYNHIRLLLNDGTAESPATEALYIGLGRKWYRETWVRIDLNPYRNMLAKATDKTLIFIFCSKDEGTFGSIGSTFYFGSDNLIDPANTFNIPDSGGTTTTADNSASGENTTTGENTTAPGDSSTTRSNGSSAAESSSSVTNTPEGTTFPWTAMIIVCSILIVIALGVTAFFILKRKGKLPWFKKD
ncbi:MAG: hypothetical protein KHW59_07275 [Clostridiales bacterium]|nr:hypothetical protein [Clostridiales bacterium]